MSLFNLFKKKEKKVEPFDKEKIDSIIQYIKENYSKPVYRIQNTEDNSLSIFDSKFGGNPYWDTTLEYPKDSKGNQLVLLAQINLEKENLELLPNKGMLQFFISCDDCYGLNFDDFTKQDTFRVIYHPNIQFDIKPIQVKTNTTLNEKEEYFPFYKQYKLSFTKDKESMGMAVEGFDDVVKEALLELYNEKMEISSYKYFSNKEYDYLYNQLNTWNHKLLGYPAFTQEDPRGSKYSIYHYDTLLLQIDSEKEILWGDSGICNFFINSKDLKQLKFDDVLYNWDCY